MKEKEEIPVFFDADSQVMPSCTTYNICGRIPGKHPERMILLSAHYDSYFSGFQDDNTAVADVRHRKVFAGEWLSAKQYNRILCNGGRGMGCDRF